MAVGFGLGCLGLFGCADRDWETAYRLERAAALASSTPETAHVDFGTEDARTLLIDGWSFNESNEAGLTFVWSHGPVSSFGLYTLTDDGTALNGSATLRFRALPFEAPDAPEQVLRFELNGRALGEVVLPSGIAESVLEFPADALINGWNVFDVHYAWIRSDLASQADRRWRRGQRDLAVSWIEASLEHPQLSREPVATTETEIDLRAERLGLPAHQLLEYEFELERGFRLVAQADCIDCDTPWRLDVYVGRPDEPNLRFAGALTAETSAVPLEVGRLDTYRLLLRNPSSGTLVLERPRIERPVPPTDAGIPTSN